MTSTRKVTNELVELWTSADWTIGIPSDLTDSLSYDQKDSLIDALYVSGAKDVIDYSGFVVKYEDTNESAAYGTCLSTLKTFFQNVNFTKG